MDIMWGNVVGGKRVKEQKGTRKNLYKNAQNSIRQETKRGGGGKEGKKNGGEWELIKKMQEFLGGRWGKEQP